MTKFANNSIITKLLLICLACSSIYTLFPDIQSRSLDVQVSINNSCSSSSTSSVSSSYSSISCNIATLVARFKKMFNVYMPIGIVSIFKVSILNFLIIERIYRPPKFA